MAENEAYLKQLDLHLPLIPAKKRRLPDTKAAPSKRRGTTKASIPLALDAITLYNLSCTHILLLSMTGVLF